MSGPKELAEKAFELLQDALRESEARANRLNAELERRERPQSALEEELESLSRRVDLAEAEQERWRREAAQLEEVLDNERAKVAQLKKKIEVSESGPEALTRREINFWRQKFESFEEQAREYRERIAALRRQIKERDRELGQLEQLEQEQAALQQLVREAERAADHLKETLAERDARIAELSARVEQSTSQQNRFEAELCEVKARAEASDAEFRTLTEAKEALEKELERQRDELARLVAQQAEQEKTNDDARQQISDLEVELREEKECSDNLSELANERREQLTKLEERLEEAEERYEDARWRLGKAAHFERLVRRRKKLIRALIAAIRSKQKSNTALKAGLDALRTYKAAAEANQQKLLARIDSLKTSLGRAEEAVARQHGATLAKEQLAEAEARAIQLEQRLATQAEIMQTLEEELKAVKAFRRGGSDDRDAELGRLRDEIDVKNRLIDSLQKEADDATRELSRLRRREADPSRLQAEADKEDTLVDTLRREVAQLREVLRKQHGSDADQDAAGSTATDQTVAEDDAEHALKRREA
jgi:chromosome segregation ATPase